jgi:hypothetical protein
LQDVGRLILELRLESERLNEARRDVRESNAVAEGLCVMDDLDPEQDAELGELFTKVDILGTRIARLTRLQVTLVDTLNLAALRPDIMGVVSLLRRYTYQWFEAMRRRDEARVLANSLDARGLSNDQDELAAELEKSADWLQDRRAELILQFIDEMTVAAAANAGSPSTVKKKPGRRPGPARQQMLDNLRSGRITPKQLESLKHEALGAEYMVAKTTAVEARRWALSEFAGNSP